MILCSVLLTSGCASIPLQTWTAPVAYNVYLQDQGDFVYYWTVVGDVAGIPAAIVVLPLLPFLGTGNPDPETGLPNSVDNETVILSRFMFGPSLVGDVVGTASLVVRRSLWDFPKWCVTGKEDGKSANQGPLRR